MAKLFYTLEEAAAKLKMSESAVKQLVASGQLGEYRDRDRAVFKVDQVDLLAHPDEEEAGVIPLAESGELGTVSLASESGSAMNLENPKEQTGISIFDADQTEEADPSAVTQVTESSPSELALETAGSGSGLMDLTREVDDTSLGQDLLEEAGAREGSTASETRAESGGPESAALFESTGAETEAAGPAMMAAFVEPYDGAGSGLAGGLAIGMIAVLGLTLTMTIFGLQGVTGGKLLTMIGSNPPMWWGIAGGVVILPGIIGWVAGRRG